MLLFFFLSWASGKTQDFFRFRADFSLKEISTLNDSLERRLIIGSCYYDKNLDKLTYRLTFPDEEQWVVADSFIYTIKDGMVLNKSAVPPITEHNIFRMLLDQTFSEFGMLKSGYEIQKVNRKGTEVYVTYRPPEQYNEVLGSLVLVKERKKLKGAIYYEPDGNMMFRQQLLDYEVIDGLPVPTQMTHIVEKSGKKIKRVLTFENVMVNEVANDKFYDTSIDQHVDQ